jgi:hypothetical protein
MKGLLVLLGLIVLGLIVVSLFCDQKDDVDEAYWAARSAAAKPDSLPFQTALGLGDDSSVIIGGRLIRFGVSLISVPTEPGEAGLAVGWVKVQGSRRRPLRLATDDPNPVPLGPASLRLLAAERVSGEYPGESGSVTATLEFGAVDE